jgi:hypothetical protein
MAQSMQGIARAKAGIEPSDRGDGSVSRLLWAGPTAQRSWIQAALAFSDSILAGLSSLVISSICLYQTSSPLRSSSSPLSALRWSSSAMRCSSSCDHVVAPASVAL